jgi:outer membrane protein OmpA-like peptidoglycan-associated protein
MLTLLLVVTTTIPDSALAQTKKAEKLMDEERFGEAIKYLKKDFNTEGNIDAGILLSKCYYKLQDYTEALDALIQVDVSRIEDSDDIRFYSDVLIASDDFSQAYLMLIRQFANDQTDAKTFLWLAKTGDLLRWDTIDSGSRSFFLSGLNTPYNEHSPYFTQSDQLWFVSDLNSVQSIFPAAFSDQNIHLLHKTTRRQGVSHQVEMPSILQKNRNHFDHDGQLEAWPGKDQYALTMKQLGVNPLDATSGIYFSSLAGNKYEMVPFEYNQDCNAMHPTFNEDGSRIYFASDRPGGFGNTDIWYCDWKDDKWSEPVNLGPGVNTPYSEVYPRYHGKRIYYASDRRDVGYGGLDMYYSSEILGFKGSSNMRAPINSSYDDFSVAFINEETGFMASNRLGGAGGNDIFEFVFKPEQIFEKDLIAQIIRDIVPEGTEYRLMNANGEVIHDGLVARDGSVTLGDVKPDEFYTLHVLHEGIAAEALLSIGTRNSPVKHTIAQDGPGKFRFGMMGYDEFFLGKQYFSNPAMSKFNMNGRIIASDDTDFSAVQVLLKDDLGVVQAVIEPDLTGRFNFDGLEVGDEYKIETRGIKEAHTIDVYGKTQSIIQSVDRSYPNSFSYIKPLPSAIWMIDAEVPVHGVMAHLEGSSYKPGDKFNLTDSEGKQLKTCEVDSDGNIALGMMIAGRSYNLTTPEGSIVETDRLQILSGSRKVSQTVRPINAKTYQFEYGLPEEMTTTKIRVSPEPLKPEELDKRFSKSSSVDTEVVDSETVLKADNEHIAAEASTDDGEEFVFNPDASSPFSSGQADMSLTSKSNSSSFDLKDIYFDFDSDELRSSSKLTLDGLVVMLKENPTVNIEVGAHTDSFGHEVYNMWLSERRAKSVVKYLIRHGIDADRLQAKGYGESKLINDCVDGVRCSTADHALNRRTSIIVTNGVNLVSKTDTVASRTHSVTGAGESKAPLTRGTDLNLPRIYFDLDSDNLKQSSSDTLNELVNLLNENPDVKIAIGAHTDSRGSDSYNLQLSQRRANTVLKFLVNKGISADRLEAQGFGETQLVNSCANGVKCEETDHSLNRRTTFTIR